jgi:serine O-acetyltransferase
MSALGRFFRSVAADYAAMEKGRGKYHGDGRSYAALPASLVTRIGFQMTTAIRAMQLLRDAKIPFGPQVASRMIRHLYGAEVHWDADLAPGLALVHGNGLVLSHSARVGAGCILFHNVTLGESMDPVTKIQGAPTLGANVHVGPGAVLLGPITVGEGSKIMAGAVLTESVPAGTVVRPTPVEIVRRKKPDPATTHD